MVAEYPTSDGGQPTSLIFWPFIQGWGVPNGYLSIQIRDRPIIGRADYLRRYSAFWRISASAFFFIRRPIRDQFKTGLFWLWCSRASLSAVTTLSPALSNPQPHLIGYKLWLHAEPRRTKKSSNKVFWLLFLLKKWKVQWYKHQNWNSKNTINNYVQINKPHTSAQINHLLHTRTLGKSLLVYAHPLRICFLNHTETLFDMMDIVGKVFSLAIRISKARPRPLLSAGVAVNQSMHAPFW